MTPAIPARTCSFRVAKPAPALRALYRVERIAAFVLLVAALPLLILLAIVISLLSRRGPLVRSERVGWKGNPLAMLKFRTMWGLDPDTSRFRWIEDIRSATPEVKAISDPRVTSRFAATCRRYSLDELPQLYHVVRGEMSFVGPRPPLPAELERLYGDSSAEILSMRPGLTGLWQIKGRSRLSFTRRRRLDLILVRRGSARLYLAILLRSLPAVLSGDGAW